MPYGITQCYLPPGSGDFSPTEAALDLAIPEGRKAELTWVVVHPKIVYPRNTVTYLRNKQAVSWLGVEPVADSRKSNVLTTIHLRAT